MPAPIGVYPGTRPEDASSSGHPCANFDLHNARAYDLGLSPGEEADLQRVLTASATFHNDLRDWHLRLDQDQRDRMCVVAGVGVKTLFRLAYRSGKARVWRGMDKVTVRDIDDPHREGDGRVPVASAALEGIGDVRYVLGTHGKLPQMPSVYNDVFRWLTHQRMELPESPREAMSSHLSTGDYNSAIPHLDLSLLAKQTGRDDELDPGCLSTDEPDPSRLDRIDQELGTGLHPGFIALKLL